MLALGSGALGVSFATPRASGQTFGAPRRLAVSTLSNEAAFAGSLQGQRDGLRERGHLEGRDVIVDIRHARGCLEVLPRLAVELPALGQALFIATGAAAANAALGARADLPVVELGDQVAAGHAA